MTPSTSYAHMAAQPDAQVLAWAHNVGNTFTALGHTLSDDGSIQPCLSNTLASMWRSFYGNFGKSMWQAPLKNKLGLLNKAVLPIASYRMSRWPYQTTAANRLDKTQTKMISILLGLRVQRKILLHSLGVAAVKRAVWPISLAAGAQLGDGR